MNKTIFAAPLIIIGFCVGLCAVFNYRFNKTLKEGYSKMEPPFEPIGKTYLAQHRAYFDSPEVQRTNEIIDRYTPKH